MTLRDLSYQMERLWKRFCCFREYIQTNYQRSLTAGDGIEIDSTDPDAPVISTTGLESLNVAPSLELVETDVYDAKNPLLRVRDSGPVVILEDYDNGSGFILNISGRRYGKAVYLYLKVTSDNVGVSDWTDQISLPNAWILGRPDFSSHAIVSSDISAMEYALLAKWVFDKDSTASMNLQSWTAVDPGSDVEECVTSFAFITGDNWPVDIPTDSSGITIPNPDTPLPTVMNITMTPEADPFNIGSNITFEATVDQTPDEPLVLHLQVQGGDSRDYVMTDSGGGTWSYGPWTSYYDDPRWDVDETLEYYATGKFNGVTYTSPTLTSFGF